MKLNLTCAWARRANLLILAAALNAPVIILAQTPTSTFTYQGQLVDKGTGVPVTDTYDMKFYLRSSDTGSNPGDPVYIFDGTTHNPTDTDPFKLPVTVEKGLFTVTLNFGAGPFSGARLWLEIDTRKHDPLNPNAPYDPQPTRTEITSAPYAITAANVAGGGLAAGTYGNAVTFNNANNHFSGDGSGLSGINGASISSGQVVKSLNGLTDAVTLSQGPNVTFATSGNNLQISATGGGIWNLNGSSAYYSRGNVGIGTTVPSSLLDMSLRYDENKPYIRAVEALKFGLFATNFIVHATGAVGIGTGEPGSKISIVSGGPQLIGTALSSTFVASAGLLPSDIGADSPLANFGVATEAANYNNVSLGLRARRISAGTGWTTAAVGLTFDVDNTVEAGGGLWLASSGNVGSGNVGIGTAQPQSPLHVAAPAATSPITAMELDVATFSTINNAIASSFLTVRDVGSGKTAFKIRGDGNVGIGVDDPKYPLDVAGMARFCVLQLLGGCDIAEPFEISDRDIPKGSLVVIDDENAGKLKLASQAYDTKVAGIVSGANGVNPGIRLSQEGVMDSGENIALSGRVYALADATYGLIKPGDLLTSSGTPGHVMKVTDHRRAQGAIVGKAMSGLKQGKGMVLVLVTLQ